MGGRHSVPGRKKKERGGGREMERKCCLSNSGKLSEKRKRLCRSKKESFTCLAEERSKSAGEKELENNSKELTGAKEKERNMGGKKTGILYTTLKKKKKNKKKQRKKQKKNPQNKSEREEFSIAKKGGLESPACAGEESAEL